MQGVVIMGHSTGCQDTVRYVQKNYSVDPAAPPLLGVILQAPVRRTLTLILTLTHALELHDLVTVKIF